MGRKRYVLLMAHDRKPGPPGNAPVATKKMAKYLTPTLLMLWLLNRANPIMESMAKPARYTPLLFVRSLTKATAMDRAQAVT